MGNRARRDRPEGEDLSESSEDEDAPLVSNWWQETYLLRHEPEFVRLLQNVLPIRLKIDILQYCAYDVSITFNHFGHRQIVFRPSFWFRQPQYSNWKSYDQLDFYFRKSSELVPFLYGYFTTDLTRTPFLLFRHISFTYDPQSSPDYHRSRQLTSGSRRQIPLDTNYALTLPLCPELLSVSYRGSFFDKVLFQSSACFPRSLTSIHIATASNNLREVSPRPLYNLGTQSWERILGANPDERTRSLRSFGIASCGTKDDLPPDGVFKILRGVKRLSLGFLNDNAFVNRLFSSPCEVEHLSFTGCNHPIAKNCDISPIMTDGSRSLRCLRSLDVSDSRDLTDAGLRSIVVSLPSLVELNASSCRSLTSEFLAFVIEETSIQVLDFRFNATDALTSLPPDSVQDSIPPNVNRSLRSLSFEAGRPGLGMEMFGPSVNSLPASLLDFIHSHCELLRRLSVLMTSDLDFWSQEGLFCSVTTLKLRLPNICPITLPSSLVSLYIQTSASWTDSMPAAIFSPDLVPSSVKYLEVCFPIPFGGKQQREAEDIAIIQVIQEQHQKRGLRLLSLWLENVPVSTRFAKKVLRRSSTLKEVTVRNAVDEIMFE